MNPKELLEQYLHKINWSLKHCGCAHYTIVDHNEKDTDYVLWSESITCKTGNSISEFVVNEENIKLIGFDAVGIGADNSFVLFMNHGLSCHGETVEGDSARSG